MSNSVKTFLFFFVPALAIGIPYALIGNSIRNQNKEYTYTGTVIQHLYEPPTSGYKSYKDSKYWVLMRENKSNKVIRVLVNVPTYYSLNDGDITSFTIKNSRLHKYGNTSNSEKNLYGE